MIRRLAVTAFAIALLAAAPASAETLRDAASSLAITAPPGYVATLSPQHGAQEQSRSVFDVRMPGEIDTGCRVAVISAPGNAFLTQMEINTQVASEQYRSAVLGRLADAYNIVAADLVMHGQVVGLAATADLRPRQGIPPRALELRTLFVLLDTPLQRVSFTCLAERREFDARIQGFEAVMRGLEIH